MNGATIAGNGTTAHHSTLDARMVEEHCRTLRMPTVGASFAQLADEAVRTHQTPISFLAALLLAEVEERERGTIDRRIKDARLPRFKTLDQFDFAAAPLLSPTLLHTLAEGGYLERAEPIILIGDSRTGKTHLATGLSAWRRVSKRSGFVLRRLPDWSTSWSKRSIITFWVAPSDAGRVMT